VNEATKSRVLYLGNPKRSFLHELKEKELEFYANNPLLATDAVIIKNNQILLIERKNYPYGWALPGGFVDK